MDSIIKWLLAAIGGYLLATFGIKKLTGKHIHTHAYEWYSHLRDKIAAWLRQHPEMKGAQVGLTIVSKMDQGMVVGLRSKDMLIKHGKAGLRKVGSTLSKWGTEESENREAVTEEEISLDNLPAGFGAPIASTSVVTEDIAEEVEASSARTLKPGHAMVEITAAKNGKNAHITEEEIPLTELIKMFPQARTAAIGECIPITL